MLYDTMTKGIFIKTFIFLYGATMAYGNKDN